MLRSFGCRIGKRPGREKERVWGPLSQKWRWSSRDKWIALDRIQAKKTAACASAQRLFSRCLLGEKLGSRNRRCCSYLHSLMPEGGFGHPYYSCIDDRVTGVVRGCGEPWPGSTRSESPGSGAGPPGRKEFSSGSSFASVERSAIDVPRRSLGVQYLAGQGKQNLEKMDQEHWDLTLEVALHSPLLESNRGKTLTGDGSGMDRNGALEPQTDSLYLRPFEYGS